MIPVDAKAGAAPRGPARGPERGAENLRVVLQPALRERATHRDHTGVEVDVAPLRAEGLLGPQAGSDEEDHQGAVDEAQLLRDRVDLVPAIERNEVAHRRLRILDRSRGVVIDPLPAHSRLQYLTQGAMRRVPPRRRQRRPPGPDLLHRQIADALRSEARQRRAQGDV